MDIFLCLWVGQDCGEGFGGGLYIYTYCCMCAEGCKGCKGWMMQKDSVSLSVWKKDGWIERDRKTCMHIPVFQSHCPSIFLFALVFLCIFACLHLSVFVSLFLSFPSPPPHPPPHQAPFPPGPFFAFEFLSETCFFLQVLLNVLRCRLTY